MRRVLTWFASLAEKAAWMDGAASLDATDPVVRQLARIIVSGVTDPVERSHKLQAFVRDRIWYSRDPWGIECTPSARAIAEAGTEDCDGKARLFVALVRALDDRNLDARLRSVWTGPNFVHAQAEVQAGSGPWRVVELIVRGVGVGDHAGAHPEVI